MKIVTLCFLIKENKICLGMKKRGFGAGKYNGIGGKVEKNETIENAAIRELKEEIGVFSHADSLERVGDLKFYFKNNSDWNQHMHIFFVKNWHGDPTESEEMRPKWYKYQEIPFDKMWEDDYHWLPKVLNGKKIKGEFYFNEDGNGFENFFINEI